jgi:hypothetical protein
MKLTFIIASFTLAFCMTSCTDDTQAFTQKIEATRAELKKQDSILVLYRTEISSIAYTPPPKDGPIKYTILNVLNAFNDKVHPLITRLELMIEKNKTLLEQVKTNTGDAKDVERDYTAQVDELELMRPAIASVKSDYEKIIAEVGEDSTKVK